MAEWRGRRVGPYELVDRLGHGGMGMVYKAIDTVLDRPVAIKMMMPTGDDETNKEQTARFLVEAKAAARIQSRHVAQVLQFGTTDNGEVYIAMELLVGQTLSKLLTKEDRLETPRAVRIARHIARGMQAAHALGIVHRDLKPANVMIVSVDGEDDVAKILDFGVAKLTKDNTGGLTQQGALLGTLPFMAPEQIESRKVDARTDVYALGCILYRMLTGTPQFDVESLSDLVRHQLTTPPEPLRVRAPQAGISEQLERVVLRCLEKEPDKRFPSMKDLDFALAAAVGAAPETSAPRARPEPALRKEETLPTGTRVDVSDMATLISVDIEFSAKYPKVATGADAPLPSASRAASQPLPAPAAPRTRTAVAAGVLVLALALFAVALIALRDRLLATPATPVSAPALAPHVEEPRPDEPPPPPVMTTPEPGPAPGAASEAPAAAVARPKPKPAAGKPKRPERDEDKPGFIRVLTQDGK